MSRKDIAKEFGVSKALVDKVFTKLDLHTTNNRKNVFNFHVFDTIDTEEKAYWLGFLYADGCVRELGYLLSLQLAKKDRDHIVKFKNFLGDTRDEDKCIRHVVYDRGEGFGINDGYAYRVYCKQIFKSLVKCGCVPRKSLILKFPDESIFAKKELIYDFIRGYTDGDGCICEDRERLSIAMAGTYDFLSGVLRYLPQFPNVYKRSDARIFEIKCRFNKADEAAYRLYEHATIYLDRKYLRYATLCKLHNSETSDKIGESCDANAEVTPEIAKGSESTVENSE
jgi:hypothetical protein